MKKKLKGFTLVELIIVMALMTALMLMVGLIMKPISQVFADTTKYTEDRYVMDGMAAVIDENLKYADKICVIYDADMYGMAGSWLDIVADEMQVDEKKLQVLGIINKLPASSSWADDFTTNSGVEATGRIYKSAYVDGARKVWLVGGEAFYGDGSYFVNLENTAGVDHMAAGDIRYTIYSFDPKQYAKRDSLDIDIMLDAMRDSTRDQIKAYPFNDVISNYAEEGIRFVNTPNFGTLWNDGTYDRGWKSPIDASIGARDSLGNAGINSIVVNPGYNIIIYYTVPD